MTRMRLLVKPLRVASRPRERFGFSLHADYKTSHQGMPRVARAPRLRPLGMFLQQPAVHCSHLFRLRSRTALLLFDDRQKIQWMRENPLVCVEVDEIRAHDDWSSVVVLGKYVEIPNNEDNQKGWEYARALFQKRPRWWQSGYTAAQVRRNPKPPEPVFYCILIEQLTGLQGSPDFSESAKRKRASGKS